MNILWWHFIRYAVTFRRLETLRVSSFFVTGWYDEWYYHGFLLWRWALITLINKNWWSLLNLWSWSEQNKSMSEHCYNLLIKPPVHNFNNMYEPSTAFSSGSQLTHSHVFSVRHRDIFCEYFKSNRNQIMYASAIYAFYNFTIDGEGLKLHIWLDLIVFSMGRKKQQLNSIQLLIRSLLNYTDNLIEQPTFCRWHFANNPLNGNSAIVVRVQMHCLSVVLIY